MVRIDALLDAFLNVNILICVAFALWCASRGILRSFGYKNAYSTELRLLNGVFFVILLAPVASGMFRALQSSGIATGVNLNLSDMVVSHYLNGGFEMKASQFESLVLARDTFVLNVSQGIGWLAWAAIAVFAAGFVVGIVRLVYSMTCLHRIVSQSYGWRRFGRIRIRLSDRVLVPFSTRGVRNYYVIIPTHMLTDATALKVALAHEFQHIRQGDLEWEILLEAMKPVFFLNPAYHAWKRRVEDLRELNCDSQVLSRGRIDARAYCDTLLSVCQTSLRRDRAFVIAVPKVTLVTADRTVLRDGKQSFIEQRIMSILAATRLARPGVVYAALMLPLAVAVIFTSLAIQSPGDWSHDRLMLSTVVNLERLDEINRLSTFGRIRD